MSIDGVSRTALKADHPSIGMEPRRVRAMSHFYRHTIRTVLSLVPLSISASVWSSTPRLAA